MSDETDRPPRVLVTGVPYGLLAGLTGYTLATKDGDTLLINLALCVATAAWLLVTFTLRPASWDRPRPMAVCFAGLIVLTAILVVRDPVFGFLTTVAYIIAYAILPWPWRMPAAGLVAIVSGTAQASQVDKSDATGVAVTVGILAFNVALMVGLAWILRLDENRQIELAQALTDLNRANHLLEASAAENAALQDRLLTQAKETGVLEERRRMAREIHDTVAQGLTGVIAQLQAAEQIREIPEPWRRHIDTAKDLARQSLGDARRSVDALRPEPLETAHLADALTQVADRWTAVHGVPVRVTTTGTARPMSPEAEFALLRTAQEALANIARHSQASRAAITLSYLDSEVALDVLDDGRGFDPGAPSVGRFGLTIMRQRVEALSGTLRIESEPGTGTGISARVPLQST